MPDYNQSLFGSFDVLSSFKAFQWRPKFPQNETLLFMEWITSFQLKQIPIQCCIASLLFQATYLTPPRPSQFNFDLGSSNSTSNMCRS